MIKGPNLCCPHKPWSLTDYNKGFVTLKCGGCQYVLYVGPEKNMPNLVGLRNDIFKEVTPNEDAPLVDVNRYDRE